MMNFDDIKILLVGTGAVGSFYGAALSRSGASVSVVARSDFDIVKEKGILIRSEGRDFHFLPHKVFPSVESCDFDPHYVVVATKVLPEINISELIRSSVSEKTSLVILQNGMGIEETVAESFPGNEVIGAIAFICAARPEYGFVDHQGLGRLVLGTYPSGISDGALRLQKMFRDSGIQCDVTEDIRKARWRKLLWNAPFNSISVAAGGADTRMILSDGGLKDLSRSIMKEVLALSAADSHPLDVEMINRTLEDTARMKPYKTSMLLDYENGRPMEVEAILGYAVSMGEKYSIETPFMRSLYYLLSMINKKNRNI